jgi:hypothetical protein
MTQFVTEHWSSSTRLVKTIVVLNWLMSTYYLYLFVGSFFKFKGAPPFLNTTSFGLSFLGMLLGGYFLLKGNHTGKLLIQFVGVIGFANIFGYICYGLTFLGHPDYDDTYTIYYTIDYVYNEIWRYAYPIIVGFLALRLPDEKLGLK